MFTEMNKTVISRNGGKTELKNIGRKLIKYLKTLILITLIILFVFMVDRIPLQVHMIMHLQENGQMFIP